MKKVTVIVLVLCLLACLLSGCGREEAQEPETTEIMRVGGLTGPTSMGMVKLMESENYEFTLSADPAAFAPALAKGELDIAAMPANLASVICNNTNGAIKVLAVNTLGVLYIVERGETVHSLADLAGKNIYATGSGAAPEFALRYLLKENCMELDKDLSVQWCADTTEAMSYITNDANAVAMLPQPFVTAAQLQLADLRVAIDMNAEWEKLDNGSAMVTGVLVARTDFMNEHPELIEKFMEEYEASVDFVLNNTGDAAELMGQYEIVKTPIALKALPFCNITFLTGDDMKTAMEGYLKVLYDMNPAAVGGKLPESDFYYGA